MSFIVGEVLLFTLACLWMGLSIPLKLSIQSPPHLTLYLSVINLFFGIILEAYQAKKQRLKLKKLYNELKAGESKKNSPAVVTDISKEKLDAVISFIHENYKSDLSREGLAIAVDMNPNYLSTLFNTYTGKKINDYINGIRIKDARQQLLETNDKIIEVAYDTGFESLATFLRAFKNETGKTPSEYRKSFKYNLNSSSFI